MTPLGKARLIAFAAPLLLLGGALGSQYIGGLYPCEMCHWQRWPHEAALVLAGLAIGFAGKPPSRPLTLLAGLAILVSGLIGVFHAGVEYGWWEGMTTCSTNPGGSGEDILKSILATPLVRCDQPQWTLGSISLAGFNAIFSIGAAALVFLFAGRRTPA